MLEVTKSALNNVKDYMHQQKIDSAIRVTMMSGGCAGPTLGLALDEAKEENDKSFAHDGVSFVVEESLFTTCGAIKVDFVEKNDGGCGCGGGGFRVTSEKPLSGGSCGGSCSSELCG